MKSQRRFLPIMTALLFVALSTGVALAQDDQGAYPPPNAPQQSYPDQGGQQSYPDQSGQQPPYNGQQNYPDQGQQQSYPSQPADQAASNSSRTLRDALRACNTCRDRFRRSPAA